MSPISERQCIEESKYQKKSKHLGISVKRKSNCLSERERERDVKHDFFLSNYSKRFISHIKPLFHLQLTACICVSLNNLEATKYVLS